MIVWRPNPGSQERALRSNAFELFYGGRAGGGKPLALNCLIPTVDGWKRNAEIVIGDFIFGEDGKPTEVIALSEIINDEDAFRLFFSDGTSIIAGENHLWKTRTTNEREAFLHRSEEWREKCRIGRKSRATGRGLRPHVALQNSNRVHTYLPISLGEIRTTKKISETLFSDRNLLKANHSIENPAPIELLRAELLIEPYTLGVWLGDGISSSGEITGIDDEVFERIEKNGFRVSHHSNKKSHYIIGLLPLIRVLGVWNHKTIPQIYLRASVEQRLALLQGLMDTDGWCEQDGSCKIALTRKVLFDGVVELLRTFGITVNISHGYKTATNGKEGNVSECWTACFVTSIPVFGLKRKLNRQNLNPNDRYGRRFIVAAENIGHLPMRCLQVKHPSGMFLAGEQFIATHNSDFLLVDALGQIGNRNYRAALFRRTFPELEKSLILRSREIYPSQGGTYNEQKHRWTFPSGATIEFGYIATPVDVFNYQSTQYAYLGFDEATHFTEFQIEYMKSRCRCAYSDIKKYVRYASNPGNRGHGYFKSRFINGKEPFRIYTNEKTKMTMQFIPSKIYDNAVLMKGDPDYVKRLEDLPDVQKKMLLHGNWDVFQGQFFNEWSGDLHTIQPFEIPATWRRVRTIDHGRTAPTACMWGAIDHDGKIWWYREYYLAGVDADLNAKAIADLSADEKYAFTILDSACFSKTGTGETIAEIYSRNGVQCEPSAKNRLAGWALFHEYLRHGDDNPPKMVFFSTCINAITTIPELIHDERRPEDLDSGQNNDHIADCLNYLLLALHESKSPKPLDPIEVKLMALKEKSVVNPSNLNRFYANH